METIHRCRDSGGIVAKPSFTHALQRSCRSSARSTLYGKHLLGAAEPSASLSNLRVCAQNQPALGDLDSCKLQPPAATFRPPESSIRAFTSAKIGDEDLMLRQLAADKSNNVVTHFRARREGPEAIVQDIVLDNTLQLLNPAKGSWVRALSP